MDLPDIGPLETKVLEHYAVIRTDRPVSGMGGVAQIPWSAIHRYALWNGYEGADHDWLVRVIRRIDQSMIEDIETRSEQKKARGSGSRRTNHAR